MKGNFSCRHSKKIRENYDNIQWGSTDRTEVNTPAPSLEQEEAAAEEEEDDAVMPEYDLDKVKGYGRRRCKCKCPTCGRTHYLHIFYTGNVLPVPKYCRTHDKRQRKIRMPDTQRITIAQ